MTSNCFERMASLWLDMSLLKRVIFIRYDSYISVYDSVIFLTMSFVCCFMLSIFPSISRSSTLIPSMLADAWSLRSYSELSRSFRLYT